MSGPYSLTADQAALTARFNMTLARRRSPSFDKTVAGSQRVVQCIKQQIRVMWLYTEATPI